MKKIRENKYFRKTADFIRSFSDRIFRDNVGVFAAQASFFLIISSLPFLMLIIALAQFVVPFTRDDAVRLIAPYVSPAIHGFVITVVSEIFEKTSVPLLSVTAATTMWTASKGVMALIQGLDNIYKGNHGSYIKERLISIAYTVVFLLIFLVSVVLMTVGKHVKYAVLKYAPLVYSAAVFVMDRQRILFPMSIALFFTFVYTFLPGSKRKFKNQLPGGVFSALGWIAFSKIYSVYIENFGNYSYVYGSLAALVLLMLWLYFCMNILLWGAEINVMAGEQREYKAEGE